jgi:hypothetical protein
VPAPGGSNRAGVSVWQTSNRLLQRLCGKTPMMSPTETA